MLTFFDNRRIAAKIGIGSGILVAILCGVSAVSVIAFDKIQTAEELAAQRSSVAKAAAELSVSFLDFRIHAREFGHTADPSEKAAAMKSAETFDHAIADAARIIVSPQRRALLADVQNGRDRYLEDFEKLAAHKAELDDLKLNTLDPLGDEVSADFKRLLQERKKAGDTAAADLLDAGMHQVLTLRLAMERAMHGEDPQLLAAAGAVTDGLVETVGRLQASAADTETRAAFAEIQDDINQFKEGLEKAVALHGTVRELLFESLPALSKSIAAAADEIHDTSTSEQAEFQSAAVAILHQSVQLVVGFAVGGILLGLGLSWAIGARIAKPVSQMRDAMRRLAGGDRSVAIPAVGRKDEIGQMAEAVDVFKANLVETERLRVEQEKLKAKSESDRRAEMVQLANQFELAVGGIIQTVSSSSSQLQSTASALSSSAQQLTGRAQTVSGASEEAAANVGTVATAAEELASSVEEIGRQVTESARVAGEAARGAESTVAKVRDLSTAAQKIGDVVDLINNIAAQTNLLALNATIEAARAGEAGKGFAVVAAEVKQLADQTARATSDIAGQIQGIQVSTADSVDAITSIADVIGRINGIASTIASAVEEQGAATREIARNVQLAAEGTSMVTENIGEVSIASSDVSAASGQVLGAAGDLNKQSQALRLEVTRFLDTVRSA